MPKIWQRNSAGLQLLVQELSQKIEAYLKLLRTNHLTNEIKKALLKRVI